MNLGYAADGAFGPDDGGADRNAGITALADDQALPPGGEIALDDAGRLEAEVRLGGYMQHLFKTGHLRMELGILLDCQGERTVGLGQIVASLDQLGTGVHPEGPVLLQIAEVGGRHARGRREFIKARVKE